MVHPLGPAFLDWICSEKNTLPSKTWKLILETLGIEWNPAYEKKYALAKCLDNNIPAVNIESMIFAMAHHELSRWMEVNKVFSCLLAEVGGGISAEPTSDLAENSVKGGATPLGGGLGFKMSSGIGSFKK